MNNLVLRSLCALAALQLASAGAWSIDWALDGTIRGRWPIQIRAHGGTISLGQANPPANADCATEWHLGLGDFYSEGTGTCKSDIAAILFDVGYVQGPLFTVLRTFSLYDVAQYCGTPFLCDRQPNQVCGFVVYPIGYLNEGCLDPIK